uniref:Uncharacterized protein n=1 Tax=Nelumbo nucifera TaxID=4432 RepID=A0A822Y6T0_NELNU|nr:TPA_asm: hypothetical protein HUJ06_029201 [Nelumbo nucifera]
MARILSQTLIRVSSPSFLSSQSPPFAPSSRLVNHRSRSNRSEKVQAQVIEVDLDSENEVEVLGMRRLEDAIHGIIVRRSAPDWLPFIPGSSYWVPPRKRPYGIVELVGRLANPLTEEETLSLTTVRGWPSFSYFVEGPQHVEIDANSMKSSQSEDEER